MRKADNLRMFKTGGTKLTEIRVKINLGRIADSVVVGLEQKKKKNGEPLLPWKPLIIT